MRSSIFFPVFLALHATAYPLRFEQPYWEIFKKPVPSPDDNPYGPMEIPSDLDNGIHHPGDDLHNDDTWPDLTRPAAVRRSDSGVLRPRIYLFQPIETAYTWLNDIYTFITDQHPRRPNGLPEEEIHGCIYKPSPDGVLNAQIICPTSERDEEQGSLTVRSQAATGPAMAARDEEEDDNEAVESVGDAAEAAVEVAVTIIGEPALWKRQASHPVQKRSLLSFLIWLFSPKPAEDKPSESTDASTTDTPTTTTKTKRSTAMRFEPRSTWGYLKGLWQTQHLGATDPETGEIVYYDGATEPVDSIDPASAYGPADDE